MNSNTIDDANYSIQKNIYAWIAFRTQLLMS